MALTLARKALDAAALRGHAGIDGVVTEASAAAAKQQKPDRGRPTRSDVLADWTRALTATAAIEREPQRTFPTLVAALARSQPDASALVGESESFTYAELDASADRIARWALTQGLAHGDVVALLMENRPAYVAIWLGLTRVGIVVALLNTNLAGASLAHCVEVAAPKAAIVSAALLSAWRSLPPRTIATPIPWTFGAAEQDARSLDRALAEVGDDPVRADRPVALHDRALLIYTSGTTGLPKAAVVSHRRLVSWALWFAGLLDIGPGDRMYDCLPLYHSVGGVVAVGALLARGGSVAIAASFSASRFWDDVRRWDCTLAQYIGELCRYVLAADPTPSDGRHRLRALCGNGLRADVWDAFQSRFAIPRILEFYASSEGTFSLYNVEGEPGAIGRIPAFLQHRFPAALVAVDAEGVPVRDERGFCRRVARDEIGEALGRIASRAGFEGYTDERASERKVLTDVFEPGDLWVRTGDLMRIDERGFWYFVDRVGDTFRWKGENVSTLEVANALTACAGVADVAVYGVAVPGAEGRAGMAAIQTGPGFDITGLAEHVTARLPSYARPLFVRLTDSLALTGTFKHRVQALAEQGFDPRVIGDAVYTLDVKGVRYLPLDDAACDAIRDGRRRL